MNGQARVIQIMSTFAVVGVLSGCTPAPLPMIALRSVDGHPTLLVLSCHDFNATRISAITEGADPPLAWWIDRSTKRAPEQVTLLTAPDGWSTSKATLTEFTPGAEYSVIAYGDPSPQAISISFTVEELDKIPPGQVLVGDSGSQRHAVPEATFRADAKDACD